MDKKTLWEYKNVSQSIKPSARAEQLSYTHHREVASLPPEKQEAVAEIVGVDQNTISVIVDNIRKRQLSIFDKDFKPFIYSGSTRSTRTEYVLIVEVTKRNL